MTLMDRISAHQVCPQWHHRVRETNQATVKSLAIVATDDELKIIEKSLNDRHLSPFSDHHPSAALNSATIYQIMTALPRLAELTYFAENAELLNGLVEMLHIDRPWRGQLSKLKVVSGDDEGYDIESSDDLLLLSKLLHAINGLHALQYLTLKDVSLLNYPLPILAQLKEITIEGYTVCDCSMPPAMQKGFEWLPQLVRLSLNVIWTDAPPETPPLLPPTCDQLRSVKSLQLILALTSHSQLHWLNLSVTVPNVLEISLDICCLRTHLRQLMDITGTPSHRIACFHNDQQVSAEELLAEKQ
ncbi:hypothetical protein TYRP_006489 [Tyrophagus putrescentiae]|nr:hypothetical protein TYRP_006489 [Tyrophagus putrescentiae]